MVKVLPSGDEELSTYGSNLDARWRPLAEFTGHKIRQRPPHFGQRRTAVSRRGEQVADAGSRLLRELSYYGVSQVEPKRDPRDGRSCLMGVNAQHWTWRSHASACGVKLSLAAFMDAVGRPFLAPRQIDRLEPVVVLTDSRDVFAELRRQQRHLRPFLRSYTGPAQELTFPRRPDPQLVGDVRPGTQRPPAGKTILAEAGASVKLQAMNGCAAERVIMRHPSCASNPTCTAAINPMDVRVR